MFTWLWVVGGTGSNCLRQSEVGTGEQWKHWLRTMGGVASYWSRQHKSTRIGQQHIQKYFCESNIFLSVQKFSHEDNCWEQFVLIWFCTIIFGSKIRHDWCFFSLIIWLLTHWDFHKDGGLDCPLFSYTSIHHNWGQNIKITLFLTIFTRQFSLL